MRVLPSLLAADPGRLADEIRRAEDADFVAKYPVP